MLFWLLQVMGQFIKKATAEEHVWLVAILMRDLKANFQVRLPLGNTPGSADVLP